MAKKLELVIQSCEECPYLKYDGYYSMSTDSGYDCNHHKGGKRIVDSGDIAKYERACRDYKKSLETLFPQAGPALPDPFTIPEWCPLEDA